MPIIFILRLTWTEDKLPQILLSNSISVEENSRITRYYVAAIVIIDEDSKGRHTKQITELSTAFIDQPQKAMFHFHGLGFF